MVQGICLAPELMFSTSQGFGRCLRPNYRHPLDTRMGEALRHVGEMAKQLAG
ncbi:hypothetical protein [Arenimonas terrae]|uniref:hypothetical protein n=1 Tax=Arenimonas terrae TaxID=2546226 RepID=UPI00159ED97E|nr:hypothetical protein [Arenimonas terrae]